MCFYCERRKYEEEEKRGIIELECDCSYQPWKVIHAYITGFMEQEIEEAEKAKCVNMGIYLEGDIIPEKEEDIFILDDDNSSYLQDVMTQELSTEGVMGAMEDHTLA